MTKGHIQRLMDLTNTFEGGSPTAGDLEEREALQAEFNAWEPKYLIDAHGAMTERCYKAEEDRDEARAVARTLDRLDWVDLEHRQKIRALRKRHHWLRENQDDPAES